MGVFVRCLYAAGEGSFPLTKTTGAAGCCILFVLPFTIQMLSSKLKVLLNHATNSAFGMSGMPAISFICWIDDDGGGFFPSSRFLPLRFFCGVYPVPHPRSLSMFESFVLWWSIMLYGKVL